ncbi:unnamed protein product [Linum trigynum]|uniref:Chitin-binding type-1 domain-containing protein n=1 Tax=Linum trigynum TaxID=586398 RepID=A0AAV2GUR0_9ROSI
MSPLPPMAVTAESDDHRCGCKRYTSCDCGAGRCCSPDGYCGSGEGYCWRCYCGQRPCNDCHCDGSCCYPPALAEKQLPAYPTHYENATHATAVVNRRHHHGDEDDINIIVATYDDDDGNHNISSSVTSPSPSKVRWPVHRYGSAAVCGPSSTMVSANGTIVPGQCLQVTNVGNGKRAMVRVTGRHKQYHCSNTSLIVDHGVFQQLVGRSSGHGDPQARHFPISYKYVRCMSICN